jgi:hypothetical protein
MARASDDLAPLRSLAAVHSMGFLAIIATATSRKKPEQVPGHEQKTIPRACTPR